MTRSALEEDQVEHTLDEIRTALHDGSFHGRGVGHRGIIHAQALHWGVELKEALLVDGRRHGGANAARLGGLIKDGHLVRALEALADGVHVERLERAQLNEINIAALRLDGVNRGLGLLDAMEVGQDSDGLATCHGFLRGLVEHGCLVEGHALAHLHGALRLLHHLDRTEENAGAVIANHGLCDAVGSVGGGGSADFEARDAHHVGVEWL
mmetsp:Transcript_19369/g.52119  ORF Transcript_19369/g.52119 Transcript_19369/m.52119 type:complete len:210 (-) Transcript_19369:717-1346(-)